MIILFLAANTAFNGFPVLGSILARDGFLPRQLHTRGDRLAYSNGILALAFFAIVLIVAFQADVTALIQLYVVGRLRLLHRQPARHAPALDPAPQDRAGSGGPQSDAALAGDQRCRSDHDRDRAGDRAAGQVHPGRLHRDHRDGRAVRAS